MLELGRENDDRNGTTKKKTQEKWPEIKENIFF